jgi:hypothetical protein
MGSLPKADAREGFARNFGADGIRSPARLLAISPVLRSASDGAETSAIGAGANAVHHG